VKISAVIITYNEEKHIENCIQSVLEIVDEIVVVDSYSNDGTHKLSMKYDVQFIEHEFEGHVEQKNFAVSQATHNIILSLDADEALSENLKFKIKNIKSDWQADAYAFNRLSKFENKWIRHCGWYPDRKIRLFDRTKSHWGGKNPHDTIIMDSGSQVILVNSDILHTPYDSIEDYISKTNSFSSISAKSSFENGEKCTILFHVVLKPFYTFIEKYFIRLGILDGYQGFIISIISSFGKFQQYHKLYNLNKDMR